MGVGWGSLCGGVLGGGGWGACVREFLAHFHWQGGVVYSQFVYHHHRNVTTIITRSRRRSFTQVHVSATPLPLLLVAVVTVMVVAASAVQLGGYNYVNIMCLLPWFFGLLILFCNYNQLRQEYSLVRRKKKVAKKKELFFSISSSPPPPSSSPPSSSP